MSRYYERLMSTLVTRTPTYLDAIAKLGPEDARLVGMVERRFMAAVLECRRTGRVSYFDARSLVVLKRFIEGRRNPIRLVGDRHFIGARRSPPGFVFFHIGEFTEAPFDERTTLEFLGDRAA